jgi:hypothetical protein
MRDRRKRGEEKARGWRWRERACGWGRMEGEIGYSRNGGIGVVSATLGSRSLGVVWERAVDDEGILMGREVWW